MIGLGDALCVPALGQHYAPRLGQGHIDAQTQVWFKQDSSVSTVGGPNKINTLTESSANAFAYSQSTDAQRPTVQAAVLNGMRVFRFDGTDDVLLGPSSGAALTLLNGKREAWIISVLKSSTSNDAYRYAGILTSDDGLLGGNAHIALQMSGGGAGFVNVPCAAGRSAVTDAYSTKYSASGVSTNWAIVLVRIRFVGKTGIVNVNGGADESGTMSGMADAVVDTGLKRAFLFGNTFAGSSPFGGDVAEMMFGTGRLTDAEVDSLFGYLANKWALTANLPSGHPYKNGSPDLSFLNALR